MCFLSGVHMGRSSHRLPAWQHVQMELGDCCEGRLQPEHTPSLLLLTSKMLLLFGCVLIPVPQLYLKSTLALLSGVQCGAKGGSHLFIADVVLVESCFQALGSYHDRIISYSRGAVCHFWAKCKQAECCCVVLQTLLGGRAVLEAEMILLVPTLHINITSNVSSANNCLDCPNMGDMSKLRPCRMHLYVGFFYYFPPG